MQSKLMSFAESLVSVLIGYSVAILSQVIIFPMFGIDVSMSDNLIIGGIFTVISIIRSYIVRRIFNYLSIIK